MTETRAAAAAAETPMPRWRVFPAVALGVIMATLDASVINIALPTLQQRFSAPLTTVEWVALAYSVTITGLLLTAGRLADVSGRRRVYAAGLVLFTLSSALCGLAPAVGWLIAGRVLQGLGAALVSANGSALLVSAFPLNERGKALGAFGAMVGVGLALGAPLGGLVIAHASWRWIFFINVPLGVLTLALLLRNVPPDGASGVSRPPEPLAALLWCGALASLALGLSRGPVLGWSGAPVIGLFAATVVLLALFVTHQSRAAEPMLPPRILLGPLGAAVLLTLIAQGLSVAIGFQLPFYLVNLFHYGPAQTGAWNSVLPFAALVFAPVAGRLADRIGARVLTTLGMAMSAAGLAMLSGMGVTPAPWQLPAGLVLIGSGMGLFTVPNASALLSLVPHEQLGIASGLQNTTRYLGTTAGLALMGALMATRYAVHAGAPLEHPGVALNPLAYAFAMREACLTLAVVAGAGTLLSAIQRRERPAAP